jgi:pectin methylesterase-like acyl-CoA thioesterase
MRQLRFVLHCTLTVSAALTVVLLASSNAAPAVVANLSTTAAQPPAQPIIAAIHPLTFAAFQLLASLTALVAFDD